MGSSGNDTVLAGVAGGSPRQLGKTCRGVHILVDEMYRLVCGGMPRARVDRRRVLCHLRQVAMYVCHVTLQIPLAEIGRAYGRDRSTVGYACRLTEDRREDRAYDDFVSAVERTAGALLAAVPGDRHDPS